MHQSLARSQKNILKPDA